MSEPISRPGPSTRPAPDEIEPGVPATTEAPAAEVPPGWEADEQVPPRDEPQAVEEWGTTAREEMLGEPLEVRRRRQVPERRREISNDGVRVYEPDTDDAFEDQEPDAVGDIGVARDDTLSAEESAMRIDESPPGITDDDSPGYIRQ